MRMTHVDMRLPWAVWARAMSRSVARRVQADVALCALYATLVIGDLLWQHTPFKVVIGCMAAWKSVALLLRPPTRARTSRVEVRRNLVRTAVYHFVAWVLPQAWHALLWLVLRLCRLGVDQLEGAETREASALIKKGAF